MEILIALVDGLWFVFAVLMLKMDKVLDRLWREDRLVLDWFCKTFHSDASPSYIGPTLILKCRQSQCHATRVLPVKGKPTIIIL